LYPSCLATWIIVHMLGKIQHDEADALQTLAWLDEWMLEKIIVNAFQSTGASDEEAWRLVIILKILVRHQDWFTLREFKEDRPLGILESLFRDAHVRRFLGINRYHDVLWYHAESFQELMEWLYSIALLNVITESQIEDRGVTDFVMKLDSLIQKIEDAARASQFQVDRLLRALTE
jgi:hypothetical protein